MPESKSLTLIVPALDEEKNIHAVCEALTRLANQCFRHYEILVFDDASRDRTAELVKELQKDCPQIVLFKNPVNRGLGNNFREGVLRARSEYVMMVPGDDEIVVESLKATFQQVGSADLLLGYSTNATVRPLVRRLISRLYTQLLNFLFGLKLRYYNGPSVVRTDLAKQFLPAESSFAYMAVIVVQAIKAGYRYKQVPFSLRERRFGKSKAFRLKNVVRVFRDILFLFWKVSKIEQNQLTRLDKRPHI